jgi:hypothetical protein
MYKLMLVAGLAAAALTPSLAFAQQTCEQQQSNQVLTAAAGAGVGALTGAAIAPRHDRAVGAIVGAGVGTALGAEVGRPNADCAHAYGFYDRHNQWHARMTNRADARGYYDRDGAWVYGAPNGYYSSEGRWVAASGDALASGYYDDQGRWTPASADGFYDDRGQWVSSVSGHYEGGVWVAGHASGAYDTNGRWMPGARRGHADADGVWVSDAQAGYYDNDHHWRAGPVRGYYDAHGLWVAAAPSAGAYAAPASFDGDARRDLDAQEVWLERRIQGAARDGALSHADVVRYTDQLGSIRIEETGMRDGQNRLTPSGERHLQLRLDQLRSNVRASLNGVGF